MFGTVERFEVDVAGRATSPSGHNQPTLGDAQAT